MRSILLGLLVLSACGGRPDEPYSCDIAEVEGVYGQAPLDCRAIRDNILLSQEILVARGIVPAERLGDLFGTSVLHIRAVPCINGIEDAQRSNVCTGGRSYAGSHDVDLGSTTFALTHELIHRWDNLQEPIGMPVKSVVLLSSHATWPLIYYNADFAYQDVFNHDALVEPWQPPAQ